MKPGLELRSWRQVPHMMLRPLFRAWFRATTQREREWLYPAESSEVRIAGSHPIKVLVIGDGPAAVFRRRFGKRVCIDRKARV